MVHNKNERKIFKSYIIFMTFSLVGIILFLPFQKNLEFINPPIIIRKMKISGEIYIDLIGAIIPIIISLCVIFYLLLYKKLKINKYIHGLIVSISFAFILFRPSTGAITGSYILLDSIIAFLTLLTQISLNEILLMVINKNDVLRLYLICYNYSTLFILIVDLIYLPSSNYSMYIGGAGIVDAIFLCGLFCILPLLLYISFINSNLLRI